MPIRHSDANHPTYMPAALVVVIVKVFLDTFCKIFEEISKYPVPNKEVAEKRNVYDHGQQLPEFVAVWWVSFLLYVIPLVVSAVRTRFEPLIGSIIIAIGGYATMTASIFRCRSLKKFIRSLPPSEEEIPLIGRQAI